MECPFGPCDHTADSEWKLSVHWGRKDDHPGKLSDLDEWEPGNENLEGRELTEDHRRQVSQSLQKHYEELDEHHLQQSGEDHPFYGESHDPESIEQIRQNAERGSPKTIEVEETGHTVKSGWEKEIDLMLHESQYEYEYEPTYEFPDGRSYTPDFRVNGDVIEVKRKPTDWCVERAQLFMEHFDERYIVVGAEIPCHLNLRWYQRDQLIEVLN